jgi:hypothetical protein
MHWEKTIFVCLTSGILNLLWLTPLSLCLTNQVMTFQRHKKFIPPSFDKILGFLLILCNMKLGWLGCKRYTCNLFYLFIYLFIYISLRDADMYYECISYIDVLFYSPICTIVYVTATYWLIINLCFISENNWYLFYHVDYVDSRGWIHSCCSWKVNTGMWAGHSRNSKTIDLITYHHLYCLYHILWFPDWVDAQRAWSLA